MGFHSNFGSNSHNFGREEGEETPIQILELNERDRRGLNKRGRCRCTARGIALPFWLHHINIKVQSALI